MPNATVAKALCYEICDCRNLADRGSAADFNACGERTGQPGIAEQLRQRRAGRLRMGKLWGPYFQ